MISSYINLVYTHCMQILNLTIGSGAPDIDQGHQALDSHSVCPQDFGKEKAWC